MAAVAHFADDRYRSLEAVKRFSGLVAIFRHGFAEGGGLFVEIFLILPNLRRRVSPPVFEFSGNRPGNFCAVSAHCANAASTAAASNGFCSRMVCTMARALSLFPFISALRAAIGSDWAMTVPALRPMARAKIVVRSNIKFPFFEPNGTIENTPAYPDYSVPVSSRASFSRVLDRLPDPLRGRRHVNMADAVGAPKRIDHRIHDCRT
jgi:hypothetical protein